MEEKKMTNIIAKGTFSNLESFKEFLKRNIGCEFLVQFPINEMGERFFEKRTLIRIRTKDAICAKKDGKPVIFYFGKSADWDFSCWDFSQGKKKVIIRHMEGVEIYRYIF